MPRPPESCRWEKEAQELLDAVPAGVVVEYRPRDAVATPSPPTGPDAGNAVARPTASGPVAGLAYEPGHGPGPYLPLLDKLGARRRAELGAIAYETGLIVPGGRSISGG